jgi:hypothetical protein
VNFSPCEQDRQELAGVAQEGLHERLELIQTAGAPGAAS